LRRSFHRDALGVPVTATVYAAQSNDESLASNARCDFANASAADLPVRSCA
jgi:hypothetical protein